MTFNTTSPMSTVASTEKAPTRLIVELPMRVFHSLMALSFTGAYITAESERFKLLHVSLGYVLFGLVVFRLLWGFWGPRQSSLTSTWHKLTLPQSFRQLLSVTLAGAALLTLGVAILLSASGYLIYNELAGEWMGELHEFFGSSLLMLVFVHLAVIAFLSITKQSQSLRPMWSGRKAGNGPDLAKSNHYVVASLLSLGVVVFLWFQFTSN